jgi:hypothetical protein
MEARRKRDLFACVVLFAVCYSIFIMSPVQQPADSLYAMMVSQNLVRHRTFALDNYKFPTLSPVQEKKYTSNTSIYHLELIDGHIYYYYGPGSSVLSAPFVARDECAWCNGVRCQWRSRSAR